MRRNSEKLHIKKTQKLPELVSVRPEISKSLENPGQLKRQQNTKIPRKHQI